MDFEQIITLMANAVDYMDLYDAASYIVDDDLRVSVEELIEQCEMDGDSVEVAYSVVTSDLLDMHTTELNESVDIADKQHSSVKDYISDLENASNDKDLLNILDDMDQNRNLDIDIVTNIRQLFKNNRFMPLNNKIDTMIKYINVNTTKQESLNEATVIDRDMHNDNNQANVDEEELSDIEPDDEIEASNSETEVDNTDEIIVALQDRIGQQFSVAEFNKLLQNLLGQPNKLFILTSDLSSMNLDETQQLTINDDDISYVIYYDIIDMETGIIELTNAEIESGV